MCAFSALVVAFGVSACADNPAPRGGDTGTSAPAPGIGQSGGLSPDSFPSASNTGSRGQLSKVEDAIEISNDGMTVQNLDIVGHIEVNADNVTIRNIRIKSSDYWPIIVRGKHVTIENSTIIGSPGSQAGIGDSGGSNTFRSLDISGAPDGIKIGEGSSLSDSYIHDLGIAEGNHNDGVEFSGASNVTVRHNTVLNEAAQTSAVFIGGNTVPTTNVTVENNLLAGGGYTVYGPSGRPGVGPSANVKFTGNRLSTRFFPKGGSFGPVSYWQFGAGNVWSDNIWIDGPAAGSTVSP